jgi:serine/threonine protein kinase
MCRLVGRNYVVLRLLDHRNLVKLEGICRGPFSLVMEYLSQGTLYDYVQAYELSPFPNLLSS